MRLKPKRKSLTAVGDATPGMAHGQILILILYALGETGKLSRHVAGVKRIFLD
mgnify:CR=1 FL=1